MTDITPPASSQPKPKAALWIKIALTLSLILNLGLAGMLAGLATRSARDGSVVSMAISALPDQDRRALRRDLRESFRNLRDRAAPAEARANLLAILTADDFDPAAFDSALAQGRGHVVAMGGQLRAQVVARVAAMTVEERLAYAAELGERLDRRAPRSARP